MKYGWTSSLGLSTQRDLSTIGSCFVILSSPPLSLPLSLHLSLLLSLQPLRVNGVKVYTENVDKRQIIMDLEIRYTSHALWLNLEILFFISLYIKTIFKNLFSFVGNTEIDVDIKKYYCRAGIKSIQVCYMHVFISYTCIHYFLLGNVVTFSDYSVDIPDLPSLMKICLVHETNH